MEYEIEFEHALFDPSTNPSLEHAAGKRADRKANSRKAVYIPEEEPETQMH